MSAISLSECRSDLPDLVADRHLKNLENQAYIRFATNVNNSMGDEEDVAQGRQQLTALSFQLVNPGLFATAHSAVEPAKQSVQMFIIEGCVVKVHLSILEAAGLSILTSVGSVLPVYLKGRLDAWCVVFMAAYGKSVLPEDAGFPATDATTFVRACDLALDYRCSAKVCTRLFRLTLAYWSSFSLWTLHGQGDPAHEDHARLIQEINAAWRLYKDSSLRHCRFSRLRITDLAFGVLLWVHCPPCVRQVHAAELDDDLQNYVVVAGLLMACRPASICSNDWILVGFPHI